MELRPSDYMRVLDAQGRAQGQAGRIKAEDMYNASGSPLDFRSWMMQNRPVMNNGQMYIASDPEHATIMNHISTGNRQPLNLGTETTTAPPAPSNLNVPITPSLSYDEETKLMNAKLREYEQSINTSKPFDITKFREENPDLFKKSDEPISNIKKYMDQISSTQRTKINDLWRQAHSSGQTDLPAMAWVDKNWDSFSDILADNSGPDEQTKLMNARIKEYEKSIAPPASNIKKYMDEITSGQRTRIKDLWRQAHESGETDLPDMVWVDKNWDSFSDILKNSGGQKQIPAPDNRTVPISKELPAMFDNRTVPISKELPKMETASTPIAQKPQDRAISAMQPNTMRDVAKDNYTSAGMKENKTLTDQRQATTDARQAAFDALKKRRMQ